MTSLMIHTIADAKGWLEAKGGPWTKVLTPQGWEVIAWVGPFSKRRPAGDGAIDDALIDAVAQLDRDPVLS